MLHDYGCDPNIEGNLLLHEACGMGNLSLVETLITHGADLNALDESNHTPLMVAVQNKNYQIVKALLRDYGCDPNIEGNLLLHEACGMGNLRLVEILITHGADLNALDEHGYTPLMVAVKHYGNDKIVESLICDYNCDVNVRASNGYSLLHIAAANNLLSQIRILISRFGMSPFVVDKDGNTPLHLCASKGWAACVRSLLNEFHHRLYSPIYIRNAAGKTPIEVTEYYGIEK